ncbi:MAG: cysteine desulfurase [Clostridiales bacterium]|nr:cysteine desulfurase [Clostridiales bacterium]
MFVYLDNSATTRQYDAVTEKMIKYMKEDFGNPSSLHRPGIDAEKAVKEARRLVASAIGCADDELYFTSGGTESDNTAIFGAAEAGKRRGNRIITTQVEHPAVLESVKRLGDSGFDVVFLPVNSDGSVNMDALKEAVNSETILVSIMQVNNESGIIMPTGEIASYITGFNKSNGTEVLFHVDAVQSFGKMRVMKPGIDMMSVSAHKIHGPKGIGGLYVKKGRNIRPYIVGGGQEKHFRSGTENVPGIAGFGKAAEISYKNLDARLESMAKARTYLLEGIRTEIKDIRINSVEKCSVSGEEGLSSPSVLNISFLGTRGEVILHTLEQSGIYVSTGSACSSNKKGQSHVLTAMGLKDKEIEGAIRFSFSEENTIEEMDYVLDKLKEAVLRFRKLGSFR